jgi:hypothetical protein
MESFIKFTKASLVPRVLVVIVFFAGPLPLLTARPQSTATASQSSDSRRCSANPALASNKKWKAYKKSKHPIPPDPLPACIEIKGQSIEIQEFLQSVARDLQWRIGDNHASEDSWTFVRYLSDDELAKYSDTKVLVEPVVFSGGKAAITVRTTELSEGFARVQIATHIQGEGKSTDQISAQPGTSWPLGSKGVLEEELISALQSRYKRTE